MSLGPCASTGCCGRSRSYRRQSPSTPVSRVITTGSSLRPSGGRVGPVKGRCDASDVGSRLTLGRPSRVAMMAPARTDTHGLGKAPISSLQVVACAGPATDSPSAGRRTVEWIARTYRWSHIRPAPRPSALTDTNGLRQIRTSTQTGVVCVGSARQIAHGGTRHHGGQRHERPLLWLG